MSGSSSVPGPGDLAAVERGDRGAGGSARRPRWRRGRDRAGPLRTRRDQLVAGELGEQRRLVSVLFADLVDFTVLSRRLDPEDTRSVVDARFARWSAAVEAQGGVVEKFIGDAVMAVFGLQRSFEDDAERAVRAGLGMTAGDGRAERRHRASVRGVGPHAGRHRHRRGGRQVRWASGRDTTSSPSVRRSTGPAGRSPPHRWAGCSSASTYRQVRSAFSVEPVPGLRAQGTRRAGRRLPRCLGTARGFRITASAPSRGSRRARWTGGRASFLPGAFPRCPGPPALPAGERRR